MSNTRFILEEKFIGKEFSVLSLTDGISFFTVSQNNADILNYLKMVIKDQTLEVWVL